LWSDKEDVLGEALHVSALEKSFASGSRAKKVENVLLPKEVVRSYWQNWVAPKEGRFASLTPLAGSASLLIQVDRRSKSKTETLQLTFANLRARESKETPGH